MEAQETVVYLRLQYGIDIAPLLEDAKKVGMQKVVDWAKTKQLPDTKYSEPYPGLVLISKVQLEAFLKENGLK